MSNPTPKAFLLNAIDAAALAEAYHKQCRTLFNAIATTPDNLDYHENIKNLCNIGFLLSDDAASDASSSLKSFEALQA